MCLWNFLYPQSMSEKYITCIPNEISFYSFVHINFLVETKSVQVLYTAHPYSSGLKKQCYKDHFAQIRCAINCSWDTKGCAGCFLYYVDIALQTSIHPVANVTTVVFKLFD